MPVFAVVMVMLASVTVLMLVSPELLARQVLLAIYLDIHLRRRDSVAYYLPNLQLSAYIQSANGLPQQLGRDADIDQGTKKHVATDPAETI